MPTVRSAAKARVAPPRLMAIPAVPAAVVCKNARRENTAGDMATSFIHLRVEPVPEPSLTKSKEHAEIRGCMHSLGYACNLWTMHSIHVVLHARFMGHPCLRIGRRKLTVRREEKASQVEIDRFAAKRVF